MVDSPTGSDDVKIWIGDGSTTGYNIEGSRRVFDAQLNRWYILGIKVRPNGVNILKDDQIVYTNTFTWAKDIRYVLLGYFCDDDLNGKDTSYDWLLISKSEYPIKVVIYNPSDRPINLSRGYFSIKNDISDCLLPLIYNKTYITNTGRNIIYSSEQMILELKPYYNDLYCELDPSNELCLILGGSKTCRTFNI